MMHQSRPHEDLVSLLSERAARHPERLALRFLNDGVEVAESWTYGQLHEHACALAGALRLRADAGQRAFLLYPNGPAYVRALLGCLYAGVVAVPAFPPRSLGAQHIERIIAIARDARPSLLLTEHALVQPLDALRQSVPALRDIELLATDRALDAGRATAPDPGQGGERLALLQYTSGSTATPKGVMLTHANLMANQRAIEHAFGMREDDVVVSWLPLFHDMGLIGTLLQPLYQGASAVLFSPQQFMERPERWLDAVSRYQGTVSGAPDFAYRMCVNRADPAHVARLDLSRWRLAFCGAEPVRHETLRAFGDVYAAARFDRSALYPCYGLAEATLLVTGGRRGAGVHAAGFDGPALAARRAVPEEDGRQLVGCGQAQPEHHVVIADPGSGEPLPAGQIGEIWASGPSIAQGYWQNPEATARTFVDRGGRVYLRTGDLGFEHGGELFVAGREKDVIIVRGQNLYPQDIERSVEDGVSVLRKGRVAAFAVEIDGREGIGVASEVSPRAARLIEPDAVCRAISAQVAQAYGESPSLVLLLDAGALPITSSGKLQRAATRRAWENGSLSVLTQYQPDATA